MSEYNFLCQCWIAFFLSLVALTGFYYLLRKNKREKNNFLKILNYLEKIYCHLKDIEYGRSRRMERVDEFEEQMRKAGALHNDGLEYVYDELFTKAKSLDDFQPIMKNAVESFIKNHPSFSQEAYSVLTDKMFARFNKSYIFADDDLWNDDDENNFTNSQKQYLALIDKVIASEYDVYNKISELDNIKSLAFKNSNEEDLYFVIAAIEIAKASICYWDKNFQKWIELRNKFEKNNNWKWINNAITVVKKDVVGARIGLELVGGVVLFAPEVLSLKLKVIGVGGTALFYSAANAVKQIIGKNENNGKN